ncbi:hypothetical protein CS053_07110 [Rhodanobacter glycinis]|jgi:hypothetical protein|uniref:Uncharacterized protein n=1 Tax=Rhodanobacter glycinis TaxID=582702 RepID=A0A5B9E1B7_9GAMM|nr:hypothetical protein [Rhodanobacter glycinis]QEE24300.1 hypothetical protein CS053_07110 [Rhodanobacter glycinis]
MESHDEAGFIAASSRGWPLIPAFSPEGRRRKSECHHAKVDFARARHRAICRNMILSSTRYYFWFYGYPMPAAESGARLQ